MVRMLQSAEEFETLKKGGKPVRPQPLDRKERKKFDSDWGAAGCWGAEQVLVRSLWKPFTYRPERLGVCLTRSSGMGRGVERFQRVSLAFVLPRR